MVEVEAEADMILVRIGGDLCLDEDGNALAIVPEKVGKDNGMLSSSLIT